MISFQLHRIFRLRRTSEHGIMHYERKRWHAPKPQCVRQIHPEDLVVGISIFFFFLIINFYYSNRWFYHPMHNVYLSLLFWLCFCRFRSIPSIRHFLYCCWVFQWVSFYYSLKLGSFTIQKTPANAYDNIFKVVWMKILDLPDLLNLPFCPQHEIYLPHFYSHHSLNRYWTKQNKK